MGYRGSTEVSESLKGIQELFGVVPWDPREPFGFQGSPRWSKGVQDNTKRVQDSPKRIQVGLIQPRVTKFMFRT